MKVMQERDYVLVKKDSPPIVKLGDLKSGDCFMFSKDISDGHLLPYIVSCSRLISLTDGTQYYYRDFIVELVVKINPTLIFNELD